MPVSISQPEINLQLGLIGMTEGRRACGLAANDATTRDPDVERWILAHSERFIGDCMQPIRRAGKAFEFKGNGTKRYRLPFRNVVGIDLVERWIGFNEWEEVEGGHVIRDDTAGWFIEAENIFNEGTEYRCELLIGFDEIPPDIVELITEAVRFSYLDSPWGERRLGKASNSEGGSSGGDQSGSATYTKADHDKKWDRLVKKYRRYLWV